MVFPLQTEVLIGPGWAAYNIMILSIPDPTWTREREQSKTSSPSSVLEHLRCDRNIIISRCLENVTMLLRPGRIGSPRLPVIEQARRLPHTRRACNVPA